MRFGPLTHFDPYRKKSPPTPLPADGFLLIERHLQSYLKVTRPDGSYDTLKWVGVDERTLARKLSELGIPTDKLERLLPYVWNFRKAYVDIRPRVDPYAEASDQTFFD